MTACCPCSLRLCVGEAVGVMFPHHQVKQGVYASAMQGWVMYSRGSRQDVSLDRVQVAYFLETIGIVC